MSDRSQTSRGASGRATGGPPAGEQRRDHAGPGDGASAPVWRLAPEVGPEGPSSHLLNAYQRAALGSILPIAERAVRIAAAELASVDARTPAGDPAEAEARRQLREAMAAFSRRINELAVEYGLRYDERDWRLLLAAQLERAHQVLEDATPQRLVGYGRVPKELQERLGPDIADLQLALRTMQALLRRLRPASG